jgi:hypothetical protein
MVGSAPPLLAVRYGAPVQGIIYLQNTDFLVRIAYSGAMRDES